MSVINSYNISTTSEGNVLVNIDGVETVFNNGDMAWVLVASALVFIMAPGLGFFYSGLLRQKNASSMLFLSFAVYSVVAIQWFFWGYSLAFTENGNPFLGNLANFGFINVVEQPSGSIPVLLFALYQMQFACVTSVIYVGAFAERARLAPVLVFAFFWATIAYSAFVHWVWNADGWSAKLGDMDFAGGGPVHMSSGAAALAISIFLGKRRGYRTEILAYRPQNVGYIFLGTTLLWVGWIGFNGGSALAMNLQAVQASIVTLIAAAMGGLTWMGIDAFKTKRWSTVSFCSGIIAGLVGITPAAGYVSTPSSLAIGFITATFSNLSTYLGHLCGYDDALDIFAAHGVSGFVGAILTALFAEAKYTNLGGGVSSELDPSDGGWVNHYWVQLGYNLAAAVAIIAWSMVVSFALLFIINYIPGLKFRATEDDEIVGIDLSQAGEHIYGGLTQHLVEPGHFREPQHLSEKHSGSEASSPA